VLSVRTFAAVMALLCMLGSAGLALAQEEGPPIDVEHYKIDAELIPDNHELKAHALVTFKALKDTQSAVFEINGSLAITKVTAPDGKTVLQFLQDKVNELNVKINLGQLYNAGSEITLTFDYDGQLATPEGGPIPDKRMAYIGPEGSYLTYPARWFPFHGYASDLATSEINVTVPENWTVVGHSDEPQAPPPVVKGKKTFSFVQKQPVMPGTLAAGQFINRSVTSAGISIDMNVYPGSDTRLNDFAQEIAQIIQFYNSKFGQFAFGSHYVVAEVDDETLESYSGPGIVLLSHKMLTTDRDIPVEILARAVALQWWGQAVALKRFEDEWISQGLAEYSSVLYRESQQSAAEFQSTLSEIMESALAFESEASISRAPAQLNDQSPAYQSVMFYKGAYVYHMLRNQIGDDKFFNLLKTFYSTYKNKKASIDDFETLTDKTAGTNLRGFFAIWVDSTGVPEFHTDYTILRTKQGKFLIRGTVRQNLDSFSGPVTVAVEESGGHTNKTTVNLNGTSAPFTIYLDAEPTDVVADPDNQYLRTSDSIRVAVIVRRGIEHMRREEYSEAEDEFKAALKLDSRSSWAWYNYGLMCMQQRNWNQSVEKFSQALGGDLRPEWLEVWSMINRGMAYDAQGMRDRAVAEYKKAQESGGDYNGAQKLATKYLGQPYKPREESAAQT
ncbi:MAG: M1 family aminopeptidase, partial [Blastocatellia bacterium]